MNKLLDFFAVTHTPYLHALGGRGTAVLLRELNPKPGQHILEFGFGSGQTLVDLAILEPRAILYGAEHAASMLKSAEERLRFCRIKRVNLQLYENILPYPEQYFDTVYCESVLAILPDADLPGIFSELFRVLKPGGHFICNESLWREGTTAQTIGEINDRCLQYFGIVQAPCRFAYPDDWIKLGNSAGFQSIKAYSLDDLPASGPKRIKVTSWRSRVFSRLGWLRSQVQPELRRTRRQWRRNERRFVHYGKYLEGLLFVFRK